MSDKGQAGASKFGDLAGWATRLKSSGIDWDNLSIEVGHEAAEEKPEKLRKASKGEESPVLTVPLRGRRSVNERRSEDVQDNGAAADTPMPAAMVNESAPANDSVSDILDRLILDESQPYYVASITGHLLYANPAYVELDAKLGHASLAAGSARNIGCDGPKSLKSVIQSVVGQEAAIKDEEAIETERGMRYFQARHLPVRNQSGEIVAVVGQYVDITREKSADIEIQAARKRFHDFARATSDWFWEMDRTGRITGISERFTALTSQPVSMFIGKSIEEVGTFGDQDFDDTQIAGAISRRAPFRNQLFELEDPDGQLLKFHLSGVPIFDPLSGEYIGFRGAGQDVTNQYREAAESRAMRRNLERTLEELTRKNLALDIATVQAESALNAKNEFLAAMSHELRTPLNAIIGFAEAMRMEVFGGLNEHYQNYSRDIMKAGKHLLSLINDVLDVTVIENGGINLSHQVLPLNDLVEQAVNMILIRANDKDIDTSGLGISTKYKVRVDQRRAIQILSNLLTNAVKFTEEGGKIGIKTRKQGSHVAVTIWDTGIGIPEDRAELVFEKFHQVTDHIYSRKEEGTGLGLHISRELARMMDGDIILESEAGKGSKFTVTFPLAKD